MKTIIKKLFRPFLYRYHFFIEKILKNEKKIGEISDTINLNIEITNAISKKMDDNNKILSILKFQVESIQNNIDYITKLIHDNNRVVSHTNNIGKIISRGAGMKNTTILFLIHNMNTWYSICDVYYGLKKEKNINVVIASIQSKFPGDEQYHRESEIDKSLSTLKIPHIRIQSVNDAEINIIMTSIAANIIFRQSPWDADIPDAFSAKNLSYARLCYIPYYAVNIVKHMSSSSEFDFQSNQDLHNLCWRIYCDTRHGFANIEKNSLLSGYNARYFGHPKLDFLHRKMIDSQSNFIKKDNINILWAPHHSINSDWLSFGTFNENYVDFLEFAREYKNINFMLRPHPALFPAMKTIEKRLKLSIDDFLKNWNSLSNTCIDLDFDYVSSFEWSDMMITDGISFLVEYPLFHKPSIFLINNNHADFNEIGLLAEQCSYPAESFSNVIDYINQYKNNHLDPLTSNIELLENSILVNKGRVHELIIDDIINTL